MLAVDRHADLGQVGRTRVALADDAEAAADLAAPGQQPVVLGGHVVAADRDGGVHEGLAGFDLGHVGRQALPLAVDGIGRGLRAEVVDGGLETLGEHVPDAFPTGDALDEPKQVFGRAKRERLPVHRVGGDEAALDGLEDVGRERAHGYGVDPVLVTQLVGLGHGLDVGDVEIGAQGAQRLELGPAQLVAHRVGPVELDPLSASHNAPVAGGVPRPDRRLEDLPGEVFVVLVASPAVVVGRHVAGLGLEAHDARGAVLAQGCGEIRLGKPFAGQRVELLEALGSGEIHLLASGHAHDHGA